MMVNSESELTQESRGKHRLLYLVERDNVTERNESKVIKIISSKLADTYFFILYQYAASVSRSFRPLIIKILQTDLLVWSQSNLNMKGPSLYCSAIYSA